MYLWDLKCFLDHREPPYPGREFCKWNTKLTRKYVQTRANIQDIRLWGLFRATNNVNAILKTRKETSARTTNFSKYRHIFQTSQIMESTLNEGVVWKRTYLFPTSIFHVTSLFLSLSSSTGNVPERISLRNLISSNILCSIVLKFGLWVWKMQNERASYFLRS